MDLPEFSTSKSSRRELQGPRPTPLKVRKDSHKIKKPPVAPHPPPQAQPPPRPIIIYTVSPKVIHVNPNEFMTLVQRLTGSSSTYDPSSLSPSSSYNYFQNNSAVGAAAFGGGATAISPAARLASIEKTKCPEGRKLQSTGEVAMVEGVEIMAEVERTGYFPGILSPNPSALPPIPPNFFSPSFDQIPMSFFHDLSPLLHSTKNFMENNNSNISSTMPSPSNFLTTNYMISPTPPLDFFNNFFEF